MPLYETDCAATYKVLIVGDHSVGKTALLDSLTGRGFKDAMYPTIGVDFVRKIFEVDGALIQLIIWDSAGQERFRSITKLQYKGIQGLILVYDVTNEASFKSLKYWINAMQNEMTSKDISYEPTPVILCGNKNDLISTKKVSTAKGHKLADKEMAFGFYETSAKTGENVHTAFHSLAFHITDIRNPKLMKSYHPHLIRPITKPIVDPNLSEKLRQFNGKNKVKDKTGTGKGQKGTLTLEPKDLTARYDCYEKRDRSSDWSTRKQNFHRERNKNESKEKGQKKEKKNKKGEERGRQRKRSWGWGFMNCLCLGKRKTERKERKREKVV